MKATMDLSVSSTGRKLAFVMVCLLIAGAGWTAKTGVDNLGNMHDELQRDYQKKRDFIVPVLQNAGFKCDFPEGAYYVMCDISEFGFANDIEFTRHLIREIGVAVVPGSSFYHDAAMGSQMVRFCFCKKDETLEAAAERLAKLSRG